MTKQFIRTADAPSSPLFAQGIRIGPNIYVSGMPGIDPKTGKVAGPTIRQQTRQAFTNCANVLHAAGATLADAVEVQVLLARPEDFAELNEEYARIFPGEPPTRSVARLGPELPGILVSIKLHAVISPR